MSCGFCHVGPNPMRPPGDPENPKWENLSALVGAQYFWWDRVFNWNGLTQARQHLFQALHVSRPGTLDTSLVSTDNINNPRSMNAVYYLAPRMALARQWGKETLAGGNLDNRQFNEYVPPTDPLAQFFVPPTTTYTPRVLKDGSDSVGALGALNRVYLNIGVFSEEWLLHFRALLGGEPIRRFRSRRAEKTRCTGPRPRCSRRTWRGISSPAVIRTISRMRRTAQRISPKPRRSSSAARSSSPSGARAATRASCRRCPPASISRTPTARIT